MEVEENNGEIILDVELPPEMVRYSPPEEEFALWVPRRKSVTDGNRGMTVQVTYWVKRKAHDRWPIDDEIRYAEERIREHSLIGQELLETMYEEELKQRLARMPTKEEFQIWLRKEKHGWSWNHIAKELYPDTRRGTADANQDEIMKVRNAHERVERLFTGRQLRRKRNADKQGVTDADEIEINESEDSQA